MKLLPRPRFFYVSPWLLAAAAGLLVLIVVTFAMSNIRREKQLMTEAMIEKAATLIRVVNSGARAAYLLDVRRGVWNLDPWNEYVQRVINHVAEDPVVLFLTVVDDRGKVIAHNNEKDIGKTLNISLLSQLGLDRGGVSTLVYRFPGSKKGRRYFEAARIFEPYRPALQGLFRRSWKRQHSGTPFLGGLSSGPVSRFSPQGGPDLQRKYYVLVGLDMSGYDRSLKRLKLQALILSLAMLLVGVGGWLSLAAVQGYRVSQKTLGDIKAFTGILIAKLPVGIIATDREGRVTTWNRAAGEMTGITWKQAAGRLPRDVLPLEFADFFSGAESTGSGEGLPEGREKEITVAVAGRKEFFLCYIMEVRDNEAKYMGQVLLLSNLTELKGLEKKMRENERLAAVGRMAAGVAHEVRNPLSSIKGLALLLKGKFAAGSRESETAGLLIQEVERMNRTVSELLSFTRPAPLNIRRIDLGELLAEEMRLVSSDAQSAHIELRMQVADNLQPVAADRDRLNQVFINILLNALQSMEKGGTLWLAAENSPGEATVIVTISDTGCGIAEENLSQVFYPYFTTKPGGTGIGLAISQKIISDHGGTIRIDSIEGQGTTVTVELPR